MADDPDRAPPDETVRRRARDEIESWLAGAAQLPIVDAVERYAGRWFVRVRGEQKDLYTIWLSLDQRSLRFETFLMPRPESNREAVFEQLLRRNAKLRGLRLAIGDEDAVFVMGERPVESVDAGVLDEVLGSVWEVVELVFRPAVRLAFPNLIQKH